MSLREIIRTADTLVRVMELAEGTATEWHHHTEVADFFVCLTGEVSVETRSPDAARRLKPGEHWGVTPPQVHRVVNLHRGRSEYLLVQGVGSYDFIRD